ncbi:zinc finger protein-like isoform X4 [Hetaerina americana]|uniref:zinc finger protein-like isoform X4 n=1 Tax=Hetaerina americana TaxID=62018 RepID=UPI003A7F5F5B
MSDTAEFEVCRLCLNSRGLLISVFGENSKLQFMLEKTIEDLINVKVVQDANHPWLVCSNCMEKLTEFQLFKRRCGECLSVFYNRIRMGRNPATKDWITNREEKESDVPYHDNKGAESPGKEFVEGTLSKVWVLSRTTESVDPSVQTAMVQMENSDAAGNRLNFMPDNNYNEVKIEESLRDEELCLSNNVDVEIKEGDIDIPQEKGSLEEDSLHWQDGGHAQDVTSEGGAGNPVHKCQICNMVFEELNLLEAHKMCKQLKEEKQLKCDVCSKTFKYKKALNTHVKSVHSMKKEHQCQECLRYFKNQSELRIHIMRHTGEKPIKCKICSKGFARNSDVNKHMVTHMDERPFKCKICSKGFNHGGNLKTHILIHTGERPFKCEICSKSFSQKSSLRGHMLTHMDERPFKCDICLKGFCTTYHLKNHVLTHTGEKPHKCEVCSKGFRKKQHLDYHMLTHERFPYQRVIVKTLYTKKNMDLKFKC